MAAPSGTLDFYFDFISPYAYLASTQIDGLAGAFDFAVRPVPVLLAALLAHGQTKGPAEIPAKQIYMVADVVRTAKELGVPIAPPASHPFNPLLPLRVATLEPRVIDPIFAALWQKGLPVDTEESLAKVLTAAGFDGAALAKRGQTAEAKEKLRLQTDHAIAAGVFGVPTFVTRGQMFWGADRLGHLQRFLEGRGIDVDAEMKRWVGVKPTAQRH
jgi:2-hydroxychromene-2-carboxylate isomerase